jgi:hypothetical protein
VDKAIEECIDNLESTDNKIRLNALQTALKLTEDKVDWVYDVWDKLVGKLDHENSYQRSIAIMLLCNLAKSDTENRLDASLGLLLAHTRDKKFITSRQCIQNVWKVAAASTSRREKVLDHLEERFRECVDEKHYNLIRQDVIQSIKSLYDQERDDTLLARAQALTMAEHEEKYRKKYEAILNVNPFCYGETPGRQL